MSGRMAEFESKAFSDPAQVDRGVRKYLRRQLDTLEHLHEIQARPKLKTPIAGSILRGLRVLHDTHRARRIPEETIVV